MKKFRNLIFILALLPITSCVETVIVGGAATGVVVAREKSVVDTKDDILINSTINKEFLSQNVEGNGNSFGVIVNEGRVLLTGVANDAKKAKKAVDICWSVQGVSEVIDEIQMIKERSPMDNFNGFFSDAAITIEVETKLTFAKNVSSLNYKTTTVNGVVYIIGTGKNSFEIKKVADIASKVGGVKKVVSHVILANDERRGKS